MKEEGEPAAARPGGNVGKGGARRGASREAIEGEIIDPIAGEFQDLRSTFARPWLEDHALAARRYADARREASHAVIIEGARRWAEVYAVDNGGTRYLPKLGDWLASQGWATDPPRRKASAAGKSGKSSKSGRKPRQPAYDPVAGAKRVAAKLRAERAAWDASGGWAGVDARRAGSRL